MITVDFNRIDLKQGSKILDIGCGEGRHTAKAWEYPDVFCVGSDRCYKDLIKSKIKLELHEKFINSIVSSDRLPNSKANTTSKWVLCSSDITNLPFCDNSFDVVICSEVLEHIQDETKALRELKRVLKVGGELAVSVPRYLPEKICWRLSKEYCTSEGGHIRIYKKSQLIKKLTQFGFEFNFSHYAHSIHTPFWWLKCLIGLNSNGYGFGSKIINLYHRLLVWDIMQKPFVTRFIDHLLNPIIGKSLVIYLTSTR
ncbi:MAG: methyltransferase domain-containing protein [Desulfamplus sp.]|nr:methyltransferase domain-containing protein [Desulfamplus sp.]